MENSGLMPYWTRDELEVKVCEECAERSHEGCDSDPCEVFEDILVDMFQDEFYEKINPTDFFELISAKNAYWWRMDFPDLYEKYFGKNKNNGKH